MLTSSLTSLIRKPFHNKKFSGLEILSIQLHLTVLILCVEHSGSIALTISQCPISFFPFFSFFLFFKGWHKRNQLLHTHYRRLVFKRTFHLLTERDNEDVDKSELKGHQTQKVSWRYILKEITPHGVIWNCVKFFCCIHNFTGWETKKQALQVPYSMPLHY